MTPMKRRLNILLALGAVAALAGCGGGGGGKSNPGTTTEPATTVGGVRVAGVVVVHETEYKFRPSKILIPRLGYYAIKAVNDGKLAHALVLTGPGLHKKTPTLAPGDSSEFKVFFKRSAKFTLFDPLDGHRAKGMVATVRVP
jgi:hypothetical protein